MHRLRFFLPALVLSVVGCSRPEPNSKEEVFQVADEVLALECLDPEVRRMTEDLKMVEYTHPDLNRKTVQYMREYIESHEALEAAGAFAGGCKSE